MQNENFVFIDKNNDHFIGTHTSENCKCERKRFITSSSNFARHSSGKWKKRKETFSSSINFDTRNFDMQIGVEGVLTLLTRFDTCAINRAIYVSTVCTPNTRYAGFIGNEYAHKIERYIHCYSTTFAVKHAPTFPIE